MPKRSMRYERVPIAVARKAAESPPPKPARDAQTIAPAPRKTEPYSIPLDALQGNGPLSR